MCLTILFINVFSRLQLFFITYTYALVDGKMVVPYGNLYSLGGGGG